MKNDFGFYHVVGEDVSKKLNQNGIKLFRPKPLETEFEEREVSYHGEISVFNLMIWVLKVHQGKCPILNELAFKIAKKPVAMIFYDFDFIQVIIIYMFFHTFEVKIQIEIWSRNFLHFGLRIISE